MLESDACILMMPPLTGKTTSCGGENSVSLHTRLFQKHGVAVWVADNEREGVGRRSRVATGKHTTVEFDTPQYSAAFGLPGALDYRDAAISCFNQAMAMLQAERGLLIQLEPDRKLTPEFTEMVEGQYRGLGFNRTLFLAAHLVGTDAEIEEELQARKDGRGTTPEQLWLDRTKTVADYKRRVKALKEGFDSRDGRLLEIPVGISIPEATELIHLWITTQVREHLL